MKDLKELCHKVSELTDNNCHTEALEVIARYFDYRDFYKRFELIEKLHDIERAMPTDLSQYRSRLSRELFQKIEKEHGTEVKDLIYQSL